MIAPLIASKPQAWSARAFARPVTPPTLRPSARKPLPVPQAVRVTSRYVKPDKATRAAKRYHAPTPPEPVVEDDCAHWFQDERWIEQPYIDPPMIISDTTGWCALALSDGGHGHGLAHGDCLSERHTSSGLWVSDYVIDGWHDDNASIERSPSVIDTAPLVKAAEKKESTLAIPFTIPASNDCLQTPRVVATVALDSPDPMPADVWQREHQARLDAQRDHIAHIARDYAAVVRDRETAKGRVAL